MTETVLTVDQRAEAITDLIATQFDHDAVTRTVVGRLIRGQVRDPQRAFEVIVDHPAVSNWRLKYADRPQCLRLSDYSMAGPDSPRRRVEQLVNDRIAVIMS